MAHNQLPAVGMQGRADAAMLVAVLPMGDVLPSLEAVLGGGGCLGKDVPGAALARGDNHGPVGQGGEFVFCCYIFLPS
jgi:hypothetical protein